MLKVGDTVKVKGTTLCGGGETECIPIGAVCVITGKEIDEGRGRVYYEVKPKTNVGFIRHFGTWKMIWKKVTMNGFRINDG